MDYICPVIQGRGPPGGWVPPGITRVALNSQGGIFLYIQKREYRHDCGKNLSLVRSVPGCALCCCRCVV